MRIHTGRLKGRKLPEAVAARPVGSRLKVSLFSVLMPRLEGASVLDLCAGVGGLGFEALSRGAARVVLVERDPEACAALEAWIATVDPGGGASVRRGDVLTGTLPEGSFDIVLLDPPFEVWKGPEGARMLERAFARVAPEGVLACKLPVKTDPPEAAGRRLVRRTPVASAAYAIFEPENP